ncbi:ATP-binding protein [Alteromonas macleodii]|jgi:light-regulated signal transduction histidine kinase (bacteriophytochrome)|uniref:histidine kinase n=1 Tax=Alteromonas macleodii TaxID=28108 RepID=A0AB36FSQ3_ALTMA|nr:ATP-binding protein [Alteromonas macleodii]OES29302.1 PAS fold family protein [Alteromonas macleodii]OES29742.1 PAS fold family protein [Alteromonas macleodii]OES30376.1 PAS fold family protein [Alteromonas macleodii]OES40450.1 PAS fold family protein [Alteromonas macleodii]
MSQPPQNINFERCEDEPIHIPESIQSYGFLIAFNYKDLKISIVSDNCESVFTEPLIGKHFLEILSSDTNERAFLEETFDRVTKTKIRLPIKLHLKASMLEEGTAIDYLAVVYDSGQNYVVELEPATEFRDTYSAEQFIKLYAMSIAPRFKEMTSLREMAQEMVSTIRYLTNMDRVVLYKFNDDYSGKVIAEAKADDMDSYQDLYFPASDIPAQARALYKTNWVRLTPDTELPPARLVPSTEASGREPLDLTRSLLRTFSPIHLQYIRNQGLRASFSISLVTDGELYGLISCHHREPSYIPQDVRLQCENLSQLFSWHLLAKEEEIAKHKKYATDEAVDAMLDRIGPANPISRVVKSGEKAFLEALNSSGFVYYSQYETITLGSTLPIELIKEIFSKASSQGGFPYTNDALYDDYPEARQYGIAGIMIIPLFEKKQYFTAWFRKETHRVQKWIGAEDEKSEDAPKAQRLKPRASFTIHTRTIKGRSTSFDKADVDTANRLNRMFLVYALDVQERMHISIQELEKQDNYRNEFLATLAHELRNPLGPIMSGASILETVDDDKTRKRVTAIINRQAEYMSKLINDLMDVSRITRGKVKLEFEKLSIQDVLSDSLEIVDQQVKAKKHNITVNYLEKDVTVYGDKARLSQIFSNIIHNAAKYTSEQGRITVDIREEGVMVVVAVKDNGMGIPEDRLKDVFNMFTQIEAHSTHTKGGLGIGLTLVSKLVMLHHGDVSVMSEGLGRGSTFEVRLPISKMAYEQSDNQEVEPTIQSQTKVMFVDDNADLIDAYCLLAESMGVTALGITSPKEAVAEFKAFKPNFVFLDIGMPDIDGYELVKMLKALPESENVKFYSQSGWGSEKYVEDSQAAGFDQHFVKPLSKDTIQSVLS